MNKIKPHAPLTLKEIENMDDLTRRRLLVKDILIQIDLGKFSADILTYYHKKGNDKCYVCAVGAAFASGHRLRGDDKLGCVNCLEEMIRFGFTEKDYYDFENVFEGYFCSESHPLYTLQTTIRSIYPESEDNSGSERTKRLRFLYQYIWDNEECKLVPLKEVSE